MKKNLVLIGMMAAGKTTLGKIVAQRYNMEFVDTDSIIENKNSMSISEIFEKKGEPFFRAEEEKEVIEILKKKGCVIAVGGGAFINKNIRDHILKSSISIWLDVDIKVLNDRVQFNNRRPLLNKDNNENKINEMYNERKKFYSMANYKINCKNLKKEVIAEKIIEIYEKQ